MKKILGSIAGVIIGLIVWAIIKYALLLSGPFVLGLIGISGPNAAANLEAGAEILGFIAFIFVLRAIYRLITQKKDEQKKAIANSAETKE